MKVRLKLKKKAKGGNAPPFLSPGPNSRQFPYYWPGNDWNVPDTETRDTLQPVDPEDATMEAERNEEIFVPNVAGLPAKYTVGGNRHSSGGTPLNVPDNSFVFSDTRDMKIGGEILQHFGKSKDTKKKYTPADLAKKYDINKFRKTLADPDSDQLYTVPTAEKMIANFNKKLGMLALVQESQKGFPDGIPQIAMPYLITAAVEPDQVLPLKGQPQQQISSPGASNEAGMMKRGGNAFQNSPTGGGFWQYGGNLPKAQMGDAGQPGLDPFEQAILKQIEQENKEYQKSKVLFDAERARLTSSIKDKQTKKAIEYRLKKLEGDMYFKKAEINLNLERLRNMRGNIPSDYTSSARLREQKMISKAVKDYAGMKDQVNDIVNPTNYSPSGKSVYTPFGNLSSAILPEGSFFGAFDTPYQPGHPAATVNLSQVDIESDKFVQPADTTSYVYPGPQTASEWMPGDTVKTKNLKSKYGFRTGGELPAYQKQGARQVKLVEQDPDTGAVYTTYTDGSVEKSLNGTITRKPSDKVSSKPASSKAAKATLGRYKQFSDAWWKKVREMGYDPGISEGNYTNLPLKEDVPSIQKNRGDRVYGERDWWGDTKLQESWKKRHAWFTKDHPDFDPRKPGATEEFQKKHNEYLKSKGLPEYFDTNWSKAHDVDDDFGGVTWAAPDPTKITKPEQVAKVATSTKALYPNKGDYDQGNPDAPWWLQDVIKTAGAAGDFLRIKKYMPWAPKVQPYVPEATFYDPTRELASNTEQMNIGTQGAGVFAGPQQFSSRFSGIQGAGAKNAADILGKYNNLNVGVSNQFNAQKADVMNKANEFNAKTSLDLYDKTTIANQQYDNSKNQARQELRSSYIDAITNRADAQRENAMYPEFNVYPQTGGMGAYTGLPRPLGEPVGNGMGDIRSQFTEMMKIPGMTAEAATRLLSGESRDNYYDARSEALKRGYGQRRYPYNFNPYDNQTK